MTVSEYYYDKGKDKGYKKCRERALADMWEISDLLTPLEGRDFGDRELMLQVTSMIMKITQRWTMEGV